MNITSFKDVGNLLSGLSTDLSTARMGQTGNTAASGSQAGSFQTVWNAQAGKNDSGVQQEPVKGKTIQESKGAPSDRDQTPVEDQTALQDAPTKTEDSKQPEPLADGPEKLELTQEELQEAQEVLATAVLPLIQQITQILDIPLEELDQILTDMDLTQTDLLDPEMLGAVLVKAMGEESQVSLLTADEGNVEAYQTITSALEEILETELPEEDITIGDLKNLLTELTQQIQPDEGAQPRADAVIPVEEQQIRPTDIPGPQQEQDIPVQPLPQNEEREIRQSEAGPLMEADDRNVRNEPKTEGGEQSDVRQVTTSEGATLGAETMIRRSRSQNDDQQHPDFGGQHQAQQQFFRNPLETEGPVPLPTENLSSFSDAQEIADQILDYMKAQVKEDLTSLEMQLHPASLGTLQINVASKGGILTANFIAQTDQVKTAIETQMVQLREQLEEQGVKVEAIEVTVQTHQFEQSLDQRSEQSDPREANQGRRVRRIQLGDETEGEPEELSEADRITAEMMEANGNTVDYTV